MSYKKVEALLKNSNDEIVNYNFELENGLEWYLELGTYARYFAYKASDSSMLNTVYENGKKFAEQILDKECVNMIVDCDGSSGINGTELIHDICNKLWGWKVEKNTKFSRLLGNVFTVDFGPDTFNSAQNIVNKVIENIVANNSEFLTVKKGRFSNRYSLELYANPTLNQSFKNELHLNIFLEKYLEIYHSIGNFGLVPARFNAWRGLSGQFDGVKIDDYFDLSLSYLKKYGWSNAFNVNGSNPTDYYRYINYFFLWDYVDNNGYPIDLQRNSLQYYCKNITKIIKRRSYFMVALLRLNEVLGIEKYSELRNKIFNYDNLIYNGYDEVIVKIQNYLDESNDSLHEILEQLKTDISNV